jgi:hypothetical protein
MSAELDEGPSPDVVEAAHIFGAHNGINRQLTKSTDR